MPDWAAKISGYSDDQVSALRDNAAKHGDLATVTLCEAELLRRKPPRVKRPKKQSFDESRAGHYVSEFHFVCPDELGVTRNADGTIWTGTWVVAEANANDGREYGSLVALHSSKAEPSYLQGSIKGWRKKPREKSYSEDQLVKTAFGIDFLLAPTDDRLIWRGDGSGEKGYAWAPIPAAQK